MNLDSSELKRRDLEFEKGKGTIVELKKIVLELDLDSNKKSKETEDDKATINKLKAKVSELEEDLIESHKVNDSIYSSLNMHLPNKSKFVRKTKQTDRQKSIRVINKQIVIQKVSDKQIVMDFIESLSLYRDSDGNSDLIRQNKECELKFMWMPVYKDGELTRNTIVFNHDGKMIPWFEVHKSTIKSANWGLFSLQEFNRNDMMGRYIGFKVKQGKGKEVYSVTNGTFTMDCFSYPKVFTGHGVHLANEPNWNGAVSELKVNANIKTDFVLTCDAEIIKVYDEIFYSYNYKE